MRRVTHLAAVCASILGITAGMAGAGLAAPAREGGASELSLNRPTIAKTEPAAAAKPPTPAPLPAPAPTPNGGVIYKANCAICHGMGKRGSSGARILRAINTNTGGMGQLKFLTAEQVAAIARF